jgi:hypothetical protein
LAELALQIKELKELKTLKAKEVKIGDKYSIAYQKQLIDH